MDRLKNIILFGLIVLLSVINYVWAENVRINEENVLVESFEITGAEPLEFNINASGKIMDKYISKEELKNISKELIKQLNIQGSLIDSNQRYEIGSTSKKIYYNMELVESGNNSQLVLWGKDKNNRAVTVILATYKNSLTNKGQTDLVIDVVENNNLKGLEEIERKMTNIYSKFGFNTEITTCITGTFDGKLEESEKITIVNKVLQVVNGTKIEGLRDSSLISISAYSPMIDNFIYTGYRKMNINIALRYNEYEDKTYLWMGTPIIATGY